MRTTASIRGHPVHMMLVHFPMAFLVGALLVDVAGALGFAALPGIGEWLLVSGVVSGIVAAVPGAVDLVTTLRPAGSVIAGRGVRHAVLGGASLVVLAAAWLLREDPVTPWSLALLLEFLGVVLLLGSAAAGGSLVLRHGVGVHPGAGASS